MPKRRTREDPSSQRTSRVGSWLIALACRRYPADTRDDHYREWTTELRYILTDPHTGRSLRTARALLYAADHLRGALIVRPRRAAEASRPAWRDRARTGEMTLFLLDTLIPLGGMVLWVAAAWAHGTTRHIELGVAVACCALEVVLGSLRTRYKIRQRVRRRSPKGLL